VQGVLPFPEDFPDMQDLLFLSILTPPFRIPPSVFSEQWMPFVV